MSEFMKKEEYIFDAEALAHIAELSRLDISDKNAELMLSQMREIIEFAAEISVAQTSENIKNHTPIHANRLREDIPQGSFSRAELMSASSKTSDGYFAVPDVLGSGGEDR